MAHLERRLQKSVEKLRRKLALPGAYWRSASRARRAGGAFDAVERFCLFVGYPRSGHSLVGSLLDAHPEIAISHELHVLRYLRYGFSREQLFTLIVENSEREAARGREQSNYPYSVPGQWQGRTRRLRVIGDKRGGTTIRKIASQPKRLDALRERVGVPVHLIHVIRHPLDSIARMALASPHRDPAELSDHYFAMADGVSALWERTPEDTRIDVVHEALIANPREELAALCDALGVTCEALYLDACASIVWSDPKKSRDAFAWPGALRERIEARLATYPFFERYLRD